MLLILDTSAIIAFPDILSYRGEEFELVVLERTLKELRNATAGQDRDLVSLVREARDQQSISVVQGYDVDHKGSMGSMPSSILLVSYAESVSKTQDVAIASEDQVLIDIADKRGIKTFAVSKLRGIVSDPKNRTRHLEKLVKKYRKSQKYYIIASVLASSILTALLFIVYENHEKIINTINVWGTLISIPLISVLLYLLRSRAILIYGLSEIGVGFITCIIGLPSSFQYSDMGARALIPVLGGIYIMVRGLDNVDEAVQSFTFSRHWNRFFRGNA